MRWYSIVEPSSFCKCALVFPSEACLLFQPSLAVCLSPVLEYSAIVLRPWAPAIVLGSLLVSRKSCSCRVSISKLSPFAYEPR